MTFTSMGNTSHSTAIMVKVLHTFDQALYCVHALKHHPADACECVRSPPAGAVR